MNTQLSVQLWTWGTLLVILFLALALDAWLSRQAARDERQRRQQVESQLDITLTEYRCDRLLLMRLLANRAEEQSREELLLIQAHLEPRTVEAQPLKANASSAEPIHLGESFPMHLRVFGGRC
jgi:hypothetical protein